MQTLEATFKIVTPLFLGDANQNINPDNPIRSASIKGALRFWWRALTWNRIYCAEKNNVNAALQKLHAAEARLFGIAAEDEKGGQGLFLLSVISPKDRHKISTEKLSEQRINYLIGQGLSKREAIKEGEFTVKILFKPNCPDQDNQSITDALMMFGLLGALGSRARHGLGSISLTVLKKSGKNIAVPINKDQYKEMITGLLKNLVHHEPPFTAFSGFTRLEISKQETDAMRLLKAVNDEQQMYRSYGRNGKVDGKAAEQNFISDHNLMLQGNIGKAPLRSVFGLPHNYYFSSSKKNVEVNYLPAEAAARRASPLFLHIHQLNESDFIAVHCLFQAKFLPENSMLEVKETKPNHRKQKVSFEPDWQIIHSYLDRFKKREKIHG